MSPAERLLGALEGVRQRGEGQWLARCPAHGDRNPSLSIRETSDGTVLLRCFTGCGAAEVVHAVGLELRDLFPPRDSSGGPRPKRERPFLTQRELVALLRLELTTVQLAADSLAAGEPLQGPDLDRLRLAAARVHKVLDRVAAP